MCNVVMCTVVVISALHWMPEHVMVRMHRMFGMFVLHAFSCIVKVLVVSHVFQNVLCVKCDTAAVMDFRKFRPASLCSPRKLQGNESRCIN